MVNYFLDCTDCRISPVLATLATAVIDSCACGLARRKPSGFTPAYAFRSAPFRRLNAAVIGSTDCLWYGLRPVRQSSTLCRHGLRTPMRSSSLTKRSRAKFARLPYIKFCFKNFIHGVTKLLFEYNGRAKLNSTFGLFFNLK